MEKSQKTLVLLDSHAIIHRAYHALPDFISSKGQPTGALYGIVTMLLKIITDLKPDYIIACYDLPQKTFRHEAYDAYKAGRAKTDDALVEQIIFSREIFKAFNIPMYDAPGYEADDILGTISKHTDSKKLNVIIASGDMDTLQLVEGSHVKVFTLKKGINDTILYDEKAVVDRFGFKPKLLPDYKGLRGDPSDNIIGIKGIGEKTAENLITNFGTVESIYKKLKSKNGEEEFKKIGITARVFELLKEGEEEALFSKTLATIRLDAPIEFSLPMKTFLENVDPIAVTKILSDLEFRSLISRVQKVFKIESEEEEVVEEQNDDIRKLALGVWLLNSEITNITRRDILDFAKTENLKDAEREVNKMIEERGLSFVYNKMELPLIPILEEVTRYGIQIDVNYLKKLSKEYHTELDKLSKQIISFAGREFNINSPKQLGEILFDEMKLDTLGDDAKGRRMKKTAGGARSTRESELEKLRDVHPIVPLIFQYRELQKLLSTYIDTIPVLVGKDGRLHSQFNQAGASTGRFSSSDPNLQNIPIKTELGKNIRNAFVASGGHTLMSFDYSQIELRIAALLSQDPYFLKIFKEGKDVHSAVAMKVFGVKEDEVTHEMRRRAKVINFGILYGMGVTALMQNLGTDRKEAQKFHDNYFEQFPTIKAYLDSVVEEAKKTGYTETLFGRKRYFPGLRSKIPFIRAMAERMAINAPIQGTATADIVKLAIVAIDKELKSKKLENKIHLIMQIHDELVYEVEDSVVEEAEAVIKKNMEQIIPEEFIKNRTPVPILVSVGKAKNWGLVK